MDQNTAPGPKKTNNIITVTKRGLSPAGLEKNRTHAN